MLCNCTHFPQISHRNTSTIAARVHCYTITLCQVTRLKSEKGEQSVITLKSEQNIAPPPISGEHPLTPSIYPEELLWDLSGIFI